MEKKYQFAIWYVVIVFLADGNAAGLPGAWARQ